VLKRICATGAVVAATSGAMLLGAPAHADPHNSFLSDNQVIVPVCNNVVDVTGGLVAADVPIGSPNQTGGGGCPVGAKQSNGNKTKLGY
jgi:hypothetical protein